MVQFCQEIAGNDTDLSRVDGRVIACVFERLPAHFQEQTMLRVHQRCVFWRVTEEGCVEHLDVSQHRRSLYVAGVDDQGRIDIGGDKVLIGKESDGFDAVTQILPIFFSCGRSGKSTRQANYRDVISSWSIHFDASTATRRWTLMPAQKIIGSKKLIFFCGRL